MTPTQRRSSSTGRRDRTPRRGRHRLERSYRRPARYAAAGLLALTGAVSAPLVQHDSRAAVEQTAPRTTTVRPLAARPSARVVTPRRATRGAAVRKAVTRQARPAPLVLRGRATWYGPGFDGRRTASGEVFRSRLALTAAHRTLPFGTRLRVCYSGRCVVVRVNDRGPFGNAILDLSWLAASRIGLVHAGIGHVTATVVRSAA
ncbi:MAG TPA: septal ring lytic transglycosylase RlpA family protein [Frankiaceae bacterium]|nr:septal ring lytic transglycosylase RlpA family protein [Frankiaceae bacterium]